MRPLLRVFLVFLALGSPGVASVNGLPVASRSPQPPPIFPDVPHGFWDEAAIKVVAVNHNWIPPVGGKFLPSAPFDRADLARAVVGEFVHGRDPYPNVVINDIAQDDPVYSSANIVVGLGWMGETKAHDFLPDKQVTKADVDQVITKALGLKAELKGLDQAHTEDGTPIEHSHTFPALALSTSLRLFARHTENEARQIRPSDLVVRDDAAYVFARALDVQGTWRMRALQNFRTFVLPNMSEDQRKVVEFAFAYVGYPYIPAGEWYAPTTSGFCCHQHPAGGFDCSGFVWWVLKAPQGGYDNTRIRGYQGWPLPERSSFEMARDTTTRIAPRDAQPGDLMFSDISERGHDWRTIDHVGIALGTQWMIHSSGPGVMIDWIGNGWWPPHFRWARRVITQSQTTQPAPTPSPSPN
ncbi:MAG: C40 family peptidase [Actinomycetota bacterium]